MFGEQAPEVIYGDLLFTVIDVAFLRQVNLDLFRLTVDGLRGGLRQFDRDAGAFNKSRGDHEEDQEEKNHVDHWCQVYPRFLSWLAMKAHLLLQ